jgi:hypothetical protein
VPVVLEAAAAVGPPTAMDRTDPLIPEAVVAVQAKNKMVLVLEAMVVRVL